LIGTAALGVCVISAGASAQFLIEDFDSGVDLGFRLAGDDTTKTIDDYVEPGQPADGENELQAVDSDGGFGYFGFISLDITQPTFQNLLATGSTITYDRFGFDDENTGAFGNNWMAINGNLDFADFNNSGSGGPGFQLVSGSGFSSVSSFPTDGFSFGGAFPQVATYSYDLAQLPGFRDLMADYAFSSGNFLQLQFAQQTNPGSTSTVYYDNFRFTGDPLFTPGDANLDGTVNLSDFLVLRRNFGNNDATYIEGDFNVDGTVNLSDFLILRRNFGEGPGSGQLDDFYSSLIPEPATAGLLAVGGLTLLRRRRS
jgi:hypothetical protein